MQHPSWPAHLWIIRHGQSTGNVAREDALARNLDAIAIKGRDVDVPLSPLGERQAAALGDWFAKLPPAARPERVLSSPYLRARHTAQIIAARARLAPLSLDERLREKEFGQLDRLTKAGIQARYPDQARLRGEIGKFYYRPPGGESWCDVLLRLRAAMTDMRALCGGKRVVIVAHQVVVLCLRYLLEGLDEKALLDIDAEGDVANCGLTEYSFDDQGPHPMRLVRYNFVAPMEMEQVRVSAEPPAGAPA